MASGNTLGNDLTCVLSFNPRWIYTSVSFLTNRCFTTSSSATSFASFNHLIKDIKFHNDNRRNISMGNDISAAYKVICDLCSIRCYRHENATIHREQNGKEVKVVSDHNIVSDFSARIGDRGENGSNIKPVGSS
jgi:hypothetical protein